MKIVQVIFGLSSGGAERLLVDLSNELAKENEIIVLTLKDDSIDNNNFYLSELSNNIKYINTGIKKGLSLKEAFHIYKTIKSINPDVVHFHLGNTLFYIIFSVLFYRRPIYIETLHNRADKINQTKFIFWIKKILYKFKIVRLCTISKDNQQSFINHYKTKDSTLIYNGRKLPEKTLEFDNVKNEIDNLKKTSKDIVFLHIGRCHEQKNQKRLISALNEIDKLNINFCLLIIGDGFESQLGYQLKHIACDKIHFLGTRKNTVDYFLNADAFCLSSDYEGMPISLIESLACKCIPICTPVSGPSEIITDGMTGFLSDDISDESYLSSLLNFIKNKESINKDFLIEYYTNNFSIQKCANLYLSLYKSLLNK